MSSFLDNLQIQPAISRNLQGYRNQAFIGGNILPDVDAGNKESILIPIQTADNIVLTRGKRGIGGPNNYMRPTAGSTVPVALEEYNRVNPLDRRLIESADAVFDLQNSKAEGAMDSLLLELEYDIATLVQDQDSYASTMKDTPSVKWDQHDQANLTIIQDIRDAAETFRQKNGHYPTDMAMGSSVWERGILDATEFTDRLKNTIIAGVVNVQIMQTIFTWLKRVHIGVGAYKDAVTDSEFTDIWGDNLILFSVKDNPNIYSPGFGFNAVKSGYPIADSFESEGGLIQNWRARKICKPVITSNTGAFLLYDVIS